MTQMNGHAPTKCGCGFHILTEEEKQILPYHDNQYWCFVNCIEQAKKRWQMRQERLGFTKEPADTHLGVDITSGENITREAVLAQD